MKPYKIIILRRVYNKCLWKILIHYVFNVDNDLTYNNNSDNSKNLAQQLFATRLYKSELIESAHYPSFHVFFVLFFVLLTVRLLQLDNTDVLYCSTQLSKKMTVARSKIKTTVLITILKIKSCRQTILSQRFYIFFFQSTPGHCKVHYIYAISRYTGPDRIDGLTFFHSTDLVWLFQNLELLFAKTFTGDTAVRRSGKTRIRKLSFNYFHRLNSADDYLQSGWTVSKLHRVECLPVITLFSRKPYRFVRNLLRWYDKNELVFSFNKYETKINEK